MLYPVCPTCRMLLADKQIPYEKAMEALKDINLTDTQIGEERRKFFQKVGLTRYCCQMRIISYVDHAKVVV